MTNIRKYFYKECLKIFPSHRSAVMTCLLGTYLRPVLSGIKWEDSSLGEISQPSSSRPSSRETWWCRSTRRSGTVAWTTPPSVSTFPGSSCWWWPTKQQKTNIISIYRSEFCVIFNIFIWLSIARKPIYFLDRLSRVNKIVMPLTWISHPLNVILIILMA